MSEQFCGKDFDMTDDEKMLRVDSPHKRLEGPYAIVYRSNPNEGRWAIVAYNWDKEPVLGMRWFNDVSGYPTTEDWGSWLVIPDQLYVNVLDGLPIGHKLRVNIDKFLAGDLKGEKLKGLAHPKL